MSAYVIRLSAVFAVMLLLTILCDKVWHVPFVDATAYAGLIFFYAFALVAVMLSRRAASQTNHRKFLNAVMAGIVAKVLLAALLILIVALIKRPSSILVVVPLFINYAVFTALEVDELLRLNKKIVSG